MKNTSPSISLFEILRGSFLVAGTTIGAGMLGLPLITAKAGLFPSAIAFFCTWLFMLFTGLYLVEVCCRSTDNKSIFSVTKSTLGLPSASSVSALFIFLYFSLMIAYCAAGGHLVHDAFEFFLVPISYTSSVLIFSGIFCATVYIGPLFITKVNFLLSVLMVVTFIALVLQATEFIDTNRFEYADYSVMWLSLPVLFSAFGYHNLVPSLVNYYSRDKRAITIMVTLGTFIPFATYLIWQWVSLGLLSQGELALTMMAGKPVTSAFTSVVGHKFMYIAGQLFAFCAITTSTLGVSFSIVDFLHDVASQKKKIVNRGVLCFVTFGVPSFFALYYPAIVDTALGIAGGYGEALLNGVLPVLLVMFLLSKLNISQ